MQRQAYNCVHNVLQAHAAAVQEFRTVVPDGKISINLNSDWGEPSNKNSEADKVSLSSLNLRGVLLSLHQHHHLHALPSIRCGTQSEQNTKMKCMRPFSSTYGLACGLPGGALQCAMCEPTEGETLSYTCAAPLVVSHPLA